MTTGLPERKVSYRVSQLDETGLPTEDERLDDPKAAQAVEDVDGAAVTDTSGDVVTDADGDAIPVDAEPADGVVSDEPVTDADGDDIPVDAEPADGEVTAEPVTDGADGADGAEAAVDGEPAEDEDPAEEMRRALRTSFGDWYVVHSYAGYENKVKTNLESRIASLDMEDYIFQVEVPTEEVTEVKNGKRQQVQRKVFPGYILVRMDLNDESWGAVRNTPGVTGFVGADRKPVPLSKDEVDRLLHRETAERPRTQAQFAIGETVKVISGPLSDFSGEISEINEDASKLKVLVSIFGRETPVEVGFDQVKKI